MLGLLKLRERELALRATTSLTAKLSSQELSQEGTPKPSFTLEEL